jgi:hypothetical protein
VKKAKGCLGVFLIFFFGVLCGIVITEGVIRERVREVVEGGPDKVVDVVVERLNKDLKLDNEQKIKLQQIVADTRIKLRQIRQRTQPEVQTTLLDAERDVRAILYTEQIPKFEEIVEKGHKQWQEKSRPETVEAKTP